IDQYLPTCARIQWRQWSNIKTAHHLTILFIIGWLLHGILYLIYFDLAPSPGMDETSCASNSVAFRQCHTYDCIINLTCILPIFVSGFFRNLAS
ncbi:unnamed protein product, partial [Rotaria socialis]